MSEWTWGVSADEGYWPVWDCATREEAIEAGLAEFDGATFYLGKCRRKPFTPSFGWVDNLLECVEEQASDEGVVFEDDTIECTKEQEKELEDELNAVLRSWWDRHQMGKHFRGLETAEVEKYTPPSEKGNE